MIPVALAAALEGAGLAWEPKAGDAFVVRGRDMDDDIFYLADMTVEVHRFPAGEVIGFNGTVEWALDSIERDAALWLPREDQLWTALGDRFRSLQRTRARSGTEGEGVAGDWVVEVEVAGRAEPRHIRAASAAEALGAALLGVLLEGPAD